MNQTRLGSLWQRTQKGGKYLKEGIYSTCSCPRKVKLISEIEAKTRSVSLHHLCFGHGFASSVTGFNFLVKSGSL